MTTRRPHIPGGRKIRHVVLASAEEDASLRAKAQRRGITVSRLLMESALGAPGDAPALRVREIAALRREIASWVPGEEDLQKLIRLLER